MKIRWLLVNTFVAAAVVVTGISQTPAQSGKLPAGLTDSSSVEEILRWLDNTSLPLARVGLETNATGPEPGEIPTNSTTYYEWAIFGPGFRLKQIDGCKVTLGVDDVEIISFSTKYPDPEDGSLSEFRKLPGGDTGYRGELSMALNRLKSNKSPFRHTKKPEKADVLGTWRTEFIVRSDFFFFPTRKKIESLLEERLAMTVFGAGKDGRSEQMGGSELTFAFDEREASEQFYAAFSRAIELCRKK